MARKLRVTVDHAVCVGNGNCLTTAPGTFVHNHERQSEVANPDGDPAERILEAAEGCPVSAIRIEDAETGQQLFP